MALRGIVLSFGPMASTNRNRNRNRQCPETRTPSARATALAVSLGVSTIALAALAGVGCVDPKGELDAYLKETENVRGTAVTDVDAGPAIDAEVPDGGFERTYFVQCLPNLALGAVKTSFKFRGAVTFVPSAGGGGKLVSSLTPLDKNVTDLGQTVGDPISLPEAAVAADGKFELILGSLTVPGAANPLSGNNVQIENGKIIGILQGEASVCGELNGQITSPIQISIDEPGDICLYRKMDGLTGPVPQLTRGDFHCP